MTSLRAYAFNWLIRWQVRPKIARAGGDLAAIRRIMNQASFPDQPGIAFRDGSVGGVPGEWAERRDLAPDAPRLLYLHGGGFIACSPRTHRPFTGGFAARGFRVFCPDYRLAPEHPYPAALLDCEAAALWLAGPGKTEFGIHALTIGGESVGAHLAVMVLLRLRDKHNLPRAFRGANLNAGFFDLGLTPSVRNWGEERLVVNTRDLTKFADGYVREGIDRRRPDVSPIYADLKGLPPALFTIGTADPLLDDTLYMSARWAAAGNGGHTAIYPGGCHVFARYPSPMSERALELIDRFLMALA
jgi:acetyl esterase